MTASRISMQLRQDQQGIVLAVALILLVVLTLLGISAMDTTILEHRLAKNNEERTHAFQAGEAGLLESRGVYTSNTRLTGLVGGATWTTLLGNISMSRNISGQPTQVSQTLPGQTQMDFKGYFTPQFTSADKAYSVTQTDSVYFETRTVGANLNADNAVQVILRNGVRQGAPKAQ